MESIVYWVLIAFGIITLYFSARPEDCEAVKDYFQGQGRAAIEWAQQQLADIGKLWNRSDVVSGVKANRKNILRNLVKNEITERIAEAKYEHAQLNGHSIFGQQITAPVVTGIASTIDFNQIRQEATDAANQSLDEFINSPPDQADILNGWIRRLLYSLMLTIMLVTDVGITVLRMEVVGFIQIPDGWRPIVNKVFLLTPLVFISAILLAKMALDESNGSLSPYVKLVPFDKSGKLESVFRKVLPYLILILGLCNSLLLVYAAAAIGSGDNAFFTPYQVFLFIGLLFLTLLAGYMGGSALFQMLFLILGLPVRLLLALVGAAVGVLLLIVASFLGLLQNIGQWIRYHLPNPGGKNFQTPTSPADGTILLGLGPAATDVVKQVGQALHMMNVPFHHRPLLYADVYAGNHNFHTIARDQIRGLAKYPPRIKVGNEPPEPQLSSILPAIHPAGSTSDATLICIVRDDEMQRGISVLKQYEQDIKHYYQVHPQRQQNPIRFVLVWLLAQQSIVAPSQAIMDTKQTLENWAGGADSLLAGTILIADDSSLMSTAPDKDSLIGRALASMIMAARYNNALSLEEIARQMKGSGCAFAALATGTVGVPGNIFNINGTLRAVMEQTNISPRLHVLVDQFFQNKLTSYQQAPTKLSKAKCALVISPKSGEVIDMVREWMNRDFGVSTNNIALIDLDLSPQINLSTAQGYEEMNGLAFPQISFLYSLEPPVMSNAVPQSAPVYNTQKASS